MLHQTAQLMLLLSLALLVPVYAFIGMGEDMYNPSCAYACRAVIATALIDCPPNLHAKRATAEAPPSVTPLCRANSTPFLSTLAICIQDRCFPEFTPTREKLEWYWYKEVTGDKTVAPKWGWQETYDKVNSTPTAVFDVKVNHINDTMSIKKEVWLAAKLKQDALEWQLAQYSKYALILFVVGSGIPIVLTALTYLPFTGGIAHWIKPRFIYPTILGRHVEPVLRLCHVPTLGQSTYIIIFSTLTLALTVVDCLDLFSFRPSEKVDVITYLGKRTGVLCMGLLPLTVLFAGRNNLLLCLSNWSHSTYLLLHRWIARLCLLLVIVHGLIETVKLHQSSTYDNEVVKPFFIWGIIGLLSCVLMCVTGQFRKYEYELFLISHVILAIFFIVGTWYHLEYQFYRRGGFQIWIYVCSAIWFFDRVVRIGRILKTGIRKATLTPIGDEVVRVDIEGVRWSAMPGQHAYLFLPAVRKWAPWENHPFSVIPTYLLQPQYNDEKIVAFTEKITEKTNPYPYSYPPLPSSTSFSPSLPYAPGTPMTPYTAMGSSVPLFHYLASPSSTSIASSRAPIPTSTSGITVFIKRNKGITNSLHSHPTRLIRALMDGPYRNTSSQPVLSTDRLILFAGGIGITGILPFVHAHPNVKLYWSVNPSQTALVRELERTIPGHVERSIMIGGRNSVERALMAEVEAGWKLVGVVACGPGKMCDDVRNRVAGLGRSYPATKWELDIEAFLW